MAGHSQFKNIMHRKEAQDSKRAKHFTKLLREITVAARAGRPDPEFNPQLRTALAHARRANMPKDNIERALRKATQEGGENYESLCYEGFGPGQIAFMVEALTDNRNRTASEIRTAFQKHGGHMAEVGYLFNHMGVIVYPAPQEDSFMETAIDAGVTDIQENGTSYLLLCARESFIQVRERLELAFGPPEDAHLAWLPETYSTVEDEDKKKTLEKLITLLEDHDDVRAVWTNWEGSDDSEKKDSNHENS